MTFPSAAHTYEADTKALIGAYWFGNEAMSGCARDSNSCGRSHAGPANELANV